MKRVCPNCAEFIDKKTEICPHCGKPVVYNNSLKEIKKTNDNSDLKKSDIPIKKERKKRQPKPSKYDMDIHESKDGTIHIDTPESLYYSSPEYKQRKAKGEYGHDKLKWWEIYRWADLTLTRRKINKIVNKNSNMPPDNLSYVSMILLTILIGFTGLHNVYAKNYTRGIIMASLFTISMVVVALSESVPFFNSVLYSLGAFPGLIVFLMWFFDIFKVIFKKYIYKKSKLEYIKRLDVETRAKLSKKYIDMSKYETKSWKERRNLKKNSSEPNINELEVK